MTMKTDNSTAPAGKNSPDPFTERAYLDPVFTGVLRDVAGSKKNSGNQRRSVTAYCNEERWGQIQCAAALLGKSESAFVGLAIERALEDLIELYREEVRQAARAFVDREGDIKCGRPKSGQIKVNLKDPKAWEKFAQRIKAIIVSEETAKRAVNLGTQRPRRTRPRELRFPGSIEDQKTAAWLLDGWRGISQAVEASVALRDVRLAMQSEFRRAVKDYSEAWLTVHRYQEDVITRIFKNPQVPTEFEVSNRDHIHLMLGALNQLKQGCGFR